MLLRLHRGCCWGYYWDCC